MSETWSIPLRSFLASLVKGLYQSCTRVHTLIATDQCVISVVDLTVMLQAQRAQDFLFAQCVYNTMSYV